MTRWRGTSGKVSRLSATVRGLEGLGTLEERVVLGAGSRRDLEAAGPELLDRLRPAGGTSSRDEARGEDDSVDQHWDEQQLDVLRQHVAPAVEQRPGPRRALEREAPAHRASDHHRLVA